MTQNRKPSYDVLLKRSPEDTAVSEMLAEILSCLKVLGLINNPNNRFHESKENLIRNQSHDIEE